MLNRSIIGNNIYVSRRINYAESEIILIDIIFFDILSIFLSILLDEIAF